MLCIENKYFISKIGFIKYQLLRESKVLVVLEYNTMFTFQGRAIISNKAIQVVHGARQKKKNTLSINLQKIQKWCDTNDTEKPTQLET